MGKVSVKKHLKELQWRLTLVALFFVAGATLAYSYQAELVPALLAPLHGEKLVYLNPAGGFSFIFLISIYAGMALSFPILVQQLYAFLRPALPKKAQKKSSVIIVGSFLLLIAGVAFGYFIAVPNALAFLYGFADQFVEASLTAESYLNFMIAYTIGIGIVFQLPLLLLLINSIKPLSPGGLLKSEKWVVLVSFIIAAIITPTPDPVNQAIIAVPVIVVYQIGVVAILITIAKTRRIEKRAAQRAARQARHHELPAAQAPVHEQPARTQPVQLPQPQLQPHHPRTIRQFDMVAPSRSRTAPITVQPRSNPTRVASPAYTQPQRQAVRTIDGVVRIPSTRQATSY